MASVQHSSISDGDRHEAKGASTALAGQALFANGNGTTTFRRINYEDLNVKPASKGYALSLNSISTAATQTPTASNTALQVSFGPVVSNSDVNIDAAGVITFKTASQYAIRYGFSFAGGASGSIVFFRVLLNGSALEPTHRVQLSSDEITEFCETLFLDATVNDTMTFQIASDSAGSSIGGLSQAAPNTSGWSASPTAEVSVYKFQGIQ